MSLYYRNSYEHLADELRRLDLLIQLRFMALGLKPRAMEPGQAGESVSRPMHLPPVEADRRPGLQETAGSGHQQMEEICRQLEALEKQIEERVAGSLEQEVFLALPELARLFGLSPFEVQTVVICLAPELDDKYSQQYAGLQHDPMSQRPGVDLVLDLLCDTQECRWQERPVLSGQATLFRNGILTAVDGPQSTSGPGVSGRILQLEPRLLDFLLGEGRLDSCLTGMACLQRPLPSMDHILVDPRIKARLLNAVHDHFFGQSQGTEGIILYFSGPRGVGKRELALGISGKLNCRMLYLDLEILLSSGEDPETLLFLAFREGLLLSASLYLDRADVLLEENSTARAQMKRVANAITEFGWLTFLAGEKPSTWPGLFPDEAFYRFDFTLPDAALRQLAWRTELERLEADPAWAEALASRFRLTPGQIRDAAEEARRQSWRGGRVKSA